MKTRYRGREGEREWRCVTQIEREEGTHSIGQFVCEREG